MAGNYVLLERIELNASAASITFANIPQSGYTDLKVVISARSDRAANSDSVIYKFNSSTTGYSYRQLYGGAGGAGIVTGSASGTPAYQFLGIIPATNNTASTFGNQEFYIPNYTGSANKSTSSDSVSENNAATYFQLDMVAGLWSNSAAITSIQFTTENSANFVQYSTFSLYGLAAVGTTPAIAPKAAGGDIIDYDGTYWIHTFLTSGTFTPQTGLTCDYLVVAGGGGGGSDGNGAGGGGGAGGYRNFTGASLTTTNYTVTVGAGGAGGLKTFDSTCRGISGTSSIFNSMTSTGGGGGAGGRTGATASTGGSGGGGCGSNATGAAGNTPSTSPSQGFAGGNDNNADNESNGGGGGAGAVGGNGTGNGGTSGAGGVGVSNSISGSAIYYAGGGGGASYRTATAIGAGGNGGGGSGANAAAGSGSVIAPNNGTTNLGGGGGGGANWVTDNDGFVGGNGGSGIVIIRYLAA